MAKKQATKLSSLVDKRDRTIAKFKRFQDFVHGLTEDPTQLNQLKLRMSKADTCWSEFEEIQDEIESMEGGLIQESKRQEFESCYFKTMAQAQEHLVTMSDSSTCKQSVKSESDGCTSTMGVKLPTLKLASFSGNYEDWLPFREMFESIVHNNKSLSIIQKFHYLRSSLTSEAANTIQSLQVTADNYEVAWDLLQQRFQNERLILQGHIRSLFEYPRVQKESATALRQLVDSMQKHIRALQALKQPTEHWDSMLMYLITSKLDQSTVRAWESTISSNKIPTMKQFTDFLHQRCQVLEALSAASSNSIKKDNQRKSQPFQSKNSQAMSHLSVEGACPMCKENHKLFRCNKFLSKKVDERIQDIKRLGLCLNCLKSGHQAKHCSAGTCKTCHAKHNTLLHFSSMANQAIPLSSNHIATESRTLAPTAEPFIPASIQSNEANISCFTNQGNKIILSTAVMLAYDREGNLHPCRVLLDSGSQANFITERFATLLRLPQIKGSTAIIGIGEVAAKSQRCVQATIRSRITTYTASLQFIILPRITQNLPTADVNISNWHLPPTIQLADPEFNIARQVDALLGAEVFFELLRVGQFRPHNGFPILQNTSIGWIVSGKINSSTPSDDSGLCCLSIARTIDCQLQKFWELEEVIPQKFHTPEEELCEAHFVANTQRNHEGRFVVRLPIKTSERQLGESKSTAMRRLQYMEKKLSQNGQQRSDYIAFMKEYQDLGHMEQVPESDLGKSHDVCYLPHHCVIKKESSTTKLRVVFDASAKTTTGVSLNDILLVGPTIQETLFSIVTRFRLPRFVMTADLEKMYRQIEVHPDDQDLQRILWKEDPQQPVSIFRLKTVTYGTASAPFLATRCLKQLALDEGEKFPDAKKSILHDFYVDDLLTGRDSIEDSLQLQRQLITVLNSAGFKLRKWSANDQRLLDQIPENDRESLREFRFDRDQFIKSLGILWSPTNDTFHFRVNSTGHRQESTKRQILSAISRIFDPLGLIGPVVVTAKIMLQQIWLRKLGWDDSLPPDLHTEWKHFQEELPLLEQLVVSRRVVQQSATDFELNGFCDASEQAYGACIYATSTSTNEQRVSHLLCSKSRVAPLNKVTLPRLELCAALLLARLSRCVLEACHTDHIKVTLWSDSTIVLAWLRGSPAQWKTFVANRVAEIHQLTKNCSWKHVRTKDNPADLISRGCMPAQMSHVPLWWQGPSWLAHAYEQPEQEQLECSDPPERKSTTTCFATAAMELVDKYSSFTKLQRVTAYCLRFVYNARTRVQNRNSGPLSTIELERALLYWVRKAQLDAFATEIRQLKDKGQVNAGSKLRSLCPFIDQDDIMRVGGRLDRSEYPYDHKHQIILPAKHALTRLIASTEHRRQLHAGPNSLLASLRQRFWPLRGRQLVRSIIHQCVTCFKAKPKAATQLMGQLPKERTQMNRAFLHTGLDYCGPIFIRENRRRGNRPVKAYIAIFVCFSTKAIHIELVGDLTSDCFLAALRRFISRRGRCVCIYSDNASTFVGAKRELQELHTLFESHEHQNNLQSFLSEELIQWKFIPPYAPNFGGLWEAAVKSAKYHLKRIVGSALLTYEEMCTTLSQIEACLNSRPLSPMSDDPSDLQPLTPGHFLIGDALTAVCEPSLQQIPINRLSRWQHVQQVTQHFWSRWYKEYLSELQQRAKWNTRSANVAPGDLVLIKEDNEPPLKWKLGRVVDTHPDRHNLIRVVSVRTSSGTVKRAISKICPLPKEEKV